MDEQNYTNLENLLVSIAPLINNNLIKSAADTF